MTTKNPPRAGQSGASWHYMPRMITFTPLVGRCPARCLFPLRPPQDARSLL